MPLFEQIREHGHYLWGDANYSVLTNVIPGRNDQRLHKLYRCARAAIDYDHTFAEARLVRYEVGMNGGREKGEILRKCLGQNVNDAVEKLAALLGVLVSCSTNTMLDKQ